MIPAKNVYGMLASNPHEGDNDNNTTLKANIKAVAIKLYTIYRIGLFINNLRMSQIIAVNTINKLPFSLSAYKNIVATNSITDTVKLQ